MCVHGIIDEWNELPPKLWCTFLCQVNKRATERLLRVSCLQVTVCVFIRKIRNATNCHQHARSYGFINSLCNTKTQSQCLHIFHHRCLGMINECTCNMSYIKAFAWSGVLINRMLDYRTLTDVRLEGYRWQLLKLSIFIHPALVRHPERGLWLKRQPPNPPSKLAHH